MNLIFKAGNHECYMFVNKDDTVGDLKKKFLKTKIQKIPHSSHSFEFLYNARTLNKNDKKLSDYKIKNNCIIKIISTDCGPGAGYIDNLEEESKSPIAKKIGFDMNLIKRDQLKINLIHFDYNMTNEENYKYFNKFKIDVVGGFYAIDDINIFKKFLQKFLKKKFHF